jgi:hypothetical protein
VLNWHYYHPAAELLGDLAIRPAEITHGLVDGQLRRCLNGDTLPREVRIIGTLIRLTACRPHRRTHHRPELTRLGQLDDALNHQPPVLNPLARPVPILW